MRGAARQAIAYPAAIRLKTCIHGCKWMRAYFIPEGLIDLDLGGEK